MRDSPLTFSSYLAALLFSLTCVGCASHMVTGCTFECQRSTLTTQPVGMFNWSWTMRALGTDVRSRRVDLVMRGADGREWSASFEEGQTISFYDEFPWGRLLKVNEGTAEVVFWKPVTGLE